MITRALIEGRMEELKRQQVNLQANLHAVDGALQDCEYWLERIHERETGEIRQSQETLQAHG